MISYSLALELCLRVIPCLSFNAKKANISDPYLG